MIAWVINDEHQDMLKRVLAEEEIDFFSWFQLDTVYTAQGGEQEFFIGNFRSDAESYPVVIGDTTVVQGNGAYFYIDDVEIFEDTLTGIAEEAATGRDQFNLWPNPSTGTFNVSIDFGNNAEGAILFFDLSGREVYQSNLSFGLNRILVPMPSGLYLYSVTLNGEPKWNGKVVIEIEK